MTTETKPTGPDLRRGITKSRAGHWTVWFAVGHYSIGRAPMLSSAYKAQQILGEAKAAIAAIPYDAAQPESFTKAARAAFGAVRQRWGV